MSQFSQMQSGDEMREHLIGKAADDAEFRAHLVADPNKAINEEFGINLPDGFALSVYEDSSTHVHLVLPPTGRLDPAVLGEIGGGHNVPNSDFECWSDTH